MIEKLIVLSTLCLLVVLSVTSCDDPDHRQANEDSLIEDIRTTGRAFVLEDWTTLYRYADPEVRKQCSFKEFEQIAKVTKAVQPTRYLSAEVKISDVRIHGKEA